MSAKLTGLLPHSEFDLNLLLNHCKYETSLLSGCTDEDHLQPRPQGSCVCFNSSISSSDSSAGLDECSRSENWNRRQTAVV